MIEILARKTVEDRFAWELADGRLQWRTANIQQSATQTNARHHDLVFPSLIVSEVENGVEKRWKNLEAVWDLVEDEGAFREYIEREVREYLNNLRQPKAYEEAI